ncbi:MAG: terpene cyclase/mutase family protein [Planctomycetes bacterium]|nr:terpene cyclase/mutase family protein [Planctomycetota bacterium]
MIGRIAVAAIFISVPSFAAGQVPKSPAAAPASGPAAKDDSLVKYDARLGHAVEKALEFLAAQQDDDGSFKGCASKANAAVASLCVMAFLAAGHTPGSARYGETINKGIDFVLTCRKDDGLIFDRRGGHPMYSHGISTLMLCEVSGMVDGRRQKAIDAALPKAVGIILAAQKIQKAGAQQGGWRYAAASNDSDISCSGWALMALRSAKGNGGEVPKEAIDEAVKFIMACRAKDGGFGYQPGGGPGLARTGTGLLCLELCGKHGEKPPGEAGLWILQHLPNKLGDSFFYYALYYCSQGMFQLGGNFWRIWAGHMYEMMLTFQQKDGSWPAGSDQEGQAGPCYSTAMAVLAMSVSYCQLPIYQR